MSSVILDTDCKYLEELEDFFDEGCFSVHVDEVGFSSFRADTREGLWDINPVSVDRKGSEGAPEAVLKHLNKLCPETYCVFSVVKEEEGGFFFLGQSQSSDYYFYDTLECGIGLIMGDYYGEPVGRWEIAAGWYHPDELNI